MTTTMTATDRTPRRSTDRDALMQGLHRYRTLARRDLGAAPSTVDPERWRRDARTRDRVYGVLAALAERSVDEAIETALARYREVPYPADGVEIDVAHLAEARALENFFLMIGLSEERKARAAKVRPVVVDEPFTTG